MLEPGRELLRIFTQFKSKTSILDDFGFYDKRQELLEQRTQMGGQVPPHVTPARAKPEHFPSEPEHFPSEPEHFPSEAEHISCPVTQTQMPGVPLGQMPPQVHRIASHRVASRRVASHRIA